MGKMDFASPASSPPTPPSPLPISVGPGCERYCFSSSPSPSPPFTPLSSYESPEGTPLLSGEPTGRRTEPSTFSLDKLPEDPVQKTSLLKACLEWLFLRCCRWWSDNYQTNIEKKNETNRQVGANEFRSFKSKSFNDFDQSRNWLSGEW